jgi:threonine/homoserine/homoserine lactone efflux protein
VLIPGPDWAYVIAAGLRDRTIVPAVGGPLAGYLALTAVAAAGVAELVARSTSLPAVPAAVYLIWLGTATVRRPSTVTRCSGAALIVIGALPLSERLLV